MRLAHQTFVVLLVAVLLAVAALGTLFAFNLERGFVSYLNARQQEQADVLAGLLAAEIPRWGSVEVIRREPRLFRQLVQRAAASAAGLGEPATERSLPEPPPEGRPDPLPGTLPDAPPGEPLRAHPPPPRPGASPPWLTGDGPPGRPPPRPPRPPRSDADPFSLGARLDLLDPGRVSVLPPRAVPANAGAPIDREIVADGRTVALLRIWPLQRVDRPEDEAFLRAQYLRIAWAAGGLILLMALLAPLVARRVTRPLSAIAAATERIARGEFDVRLGAARGDEIGLLMRNVDAMAESLARLERSRRQWIAEISHELRTPLTVLRAELEALADGVRPLDLAAVASLQDEVRQLARLVDDLHQLALADLNALPCAMGPVDLAAVVARAGERYRGLAAGRGLALELALPGAPVAIVGDAQRLEQLLANLLDNCLRYTDAPGRIALRLAAGAGRATLAVEDTAPGVPAAACAQLFEPLYRADAARSRATGGSGLGLAIARAIVAAHGGEIRAAPAALGGLAVTVTLPLPA